MAALSRLLAVSAICLSFVLPAYAHPGEHHDQAEILKEMRVRGLEALEQRAHYDGCANSEESIAREERAMLRRAATVQRLREERGLLNGKLPTFGGRRYRQSDSSQNRSFIVATLLNS
jgi:hypothetical protein